MLIAELKSKVSALVDPNFAPEEAGTWKGRRKDIDSAILDKLTNANMLPINELT